MSESTPKDIRTAVSEVIGRATVAGKDPSLKVASTSEFRVQVEGKGYSFDHEDCAKELAAILVEWKLAGSWADYHGNWAYELRHNAGIEIGKGTTPRKTKANTTVTPIVDVAPKTLTLEEQLVLAAKAQAAAEAALVTAKAEVDTLTVAIAEAAKAARRAERLAAIEAEERQAMLDRAVARLAAEEAAEEAAAVAKAGPTPAAAKPAGKVKELVLA